MPLNLEDSSIPVTVLSYTLTNGSDQPVSAELVGWLENMSHAENKNTKGRFAGKPQLTTLSHACSMEVPAGKSQGGKKKRGKPGPKVFHKGTMALSYLGAAERTSVEHVPGIAAKVELEPGESREYTFLVSWHFPVVRNIGDSWSRPWESCQKFDGGWFWKGKDTSQSVRWAMRNLFDAISRGGNFLMDMGPTPEGLLPPVSVKKLKPMGDWLRANGECVYGSQRGPHYLLDWGTCTRRGTTLYYQVFDWPQNGALVIPGLNEEKPGAGIRKISFLNHAVPVSFEQVGGDVHLKLPAKPVDALLSVLKVELDAAPVVNNSIRPLGRPLRPQTGNSEVGVGDYFLSAAFATIHGDALHFSIGSGAGAQRENLKGWTNPSDWAEWQLSVDEPGIYDLKVNYYSWMESGRFAVEVAGQSFEHTVQAGKLKGRQSPLKAGPVSVGLGQVRFKKPGAYTLSVKALEIAPQAIELEQGLMGLKDVILARD